MIRRIRGMVAVVAALGIAAACAEDPLSDLDGGPASIAATFSTITLTLGDTGTLTASVLDGRSTPLTIPVTFTACTPATTVTLDPSYAPVPVTSSQALVIATQEAPACVELTGGGLTDTVNVVIPPSTFPGAISNLTPASGSEISIASTAFLKFVPAAVAVSFGGTLGTVTSATTDTIKVLVPFAGAGPLTVSGINVTWVPGLTVALPTVSSVTPTGDFWAGDTNFTTAPVIPIPATAGGQQFMITNLPAVSNNTHCAEVVLGFGSAGPCTIYQFTLAAPTNLTISTGWNSAGDLDIYSCPSQTIATCGQEGFGGAGSANPESFTFTFPAGTHYFVVERYAGATPTNIRVTITRN